MAAILPHHRSGTLGTGRSARLKTAQAADARTAAAASARPASRRAEPTVARRLWWVAVAMGTGWLATSLVATIASVIGLGPTAVSLPVAVATAAALTALLFVRFRAIGRVDEAVVITVIVAAVGALGLLSL